MCSANGCGKVVIKPSYKSGACAREEVSADYCKDMQQEEALCMIPINKIVITVCSLWGRLLRGTASNPFFPPVSLTVVPAPVAAESPRVSFMCLTYLRAQPPALAPGRIPSPCAFPHSLQKRHTPSSRIFSFPSYVSERIGLECGLHSPYICHSFFLFV